MARLVKIFVLVCMCLSSSFVINIITKEEVKAEICGPGKYSERSGNGFSCKPTGLNVNNNAEETVSYVKNFSVSLAGIALGLSVIMIAYSAILYTSGGGDPKIIRQAKMQLLASGIGFFIAFISFVIYSMINDLFA